MGVGYLYFVKAELCPSIVPLSLTSNLEFLAIIFTFCELKFCIAVFYRPPSSNVNYFDNFCSVVESLNILNYSNFILVGDFNIDFCNTTHHLYLRLKCLWELLSLKQIVTDPTHSSPNGNQSLIDLVFLSNIQQLEKCNNCLPANNVTQQNMFQSESFTIINLSINHAAIIIAICMVKKIVQTMLLLLYIS